MPIVLDPRLRAIAEMCGQCDLLADIGADHGRLGAYMLKTGRCENVLFTDISADSLSKAKLLIHKNGLTDRCRFSVGDGLKAVDGGPDTIVIAGMGGSTISSILKDGMSKLEGAALVLEANVDSFIVRKTLSDIGYKIDAESIVKDGRRLYTIIRAVTGKSGYTPVELFCGPVLIKNRPDELFLLADFRIRVIEKALKQAENSSSGGIAAELTEEYAAWKEVVQWRTHQSC